MEDEKQEGVDEWLEQLIEVDEKLIEEKKLKIRLIKQRYHAKRMLDPKLKKKHIEKSKEWQRNNKEKFRAIQKRYELKNKDVLKEKGRKKLL